MTTTRTTLAATAHPLLTRIRSDYTAIEKYKPRAKSILAQHHAHGTSDQSVVRASDGYVLGAVEDHGHLATQRGYLTVTSRTKVADLARTLASITEPGRFGGDFRWAVELHAAAEDAAPMAAAVLAVTVAAGAVEWDTGETIADAARRLCLDAAWRALRENSWTVTTAGDIVGLVMDALGIVRHPVVAYASRYLEQRDELNEFLAEQEIEWGGSLLDASQAAARAGITPSTWRAYVTRGQAPTPDSDSGWRPATVDAWMSGRPRAGR